MDKLCKNYHRIIHVIHPCGFYRGIVALEQHTHAIQCYLARPKECHLHLVISNIFMIFAPNMDRLDDSFTCISAIGQSFLRF